MADPNEVIWCTVCGARFTRSEIKGWGCPRCQNNGIPCGGERDVKAEINWHELHILCVWAENWAHKCRGDDKTMPLVVHAIAGRLQRQFLDFGPLTLSGEIAVLPTELAKSGIELVGIETNIAKPTLVPINGPGAVGHSPPSPQPDPEARGWVSGTIIHWPPRMRALAARHHPSADDLRKKADELDAAVETGDARKIIGAWARARRLWCDCTGEDLI